MWRNRTISPDQKYKIAIIGCGALGSELARLFIRENVFFLRLVDRDFLVTDNAKTHHLSPPKMTGAKLPKAVALKESLETQNPTIKIEAVINDVNRLNILPFIQDVELVVDAVNNSFTHQLINEACVKLKKPLLLNWLDGPRGAAMTVIPGKTSCLNCVLESRDVVPDILLDKTKKILPRTISAIAEAQVARANEILKNPKSKIPQSLLVIDGKKSTIDTINITKSKIQPNCAVCNNRQFRRLDGKIGSTYIHPVGENSLQIIPFQPRKIDLPTLASNLSNKGDVSVNEFLLIFRKAPYELIIFPDGRTLVHGTTDSGIALDLLRRYVKGNG